VSFSGITWFLFTRTPHILISVFSCPIQSARAVGRGGTATSNLKRFDISHVYHKSVAGGHPREALEATFDIVQDDQTVKGHQIEVETIFVVCQALSSLQLQDGMFFFIKTSKCTFFFLSRPFSFDRHVW
jgi:hypothetical protein